MVIQTVASSLMMTWDACSGPTSCTSRSSPSISLSVGGRTLSRIAGVLMRTHWKERFSSDSSISDPPVFCTALISAGDILVIGDSVAILIVRLLFET